MNKNILNTGVQSFISINLNTDIVSVLLKKVHFDGVSTKELAEQLESKQKCREKLPTWYTTPEIYYPPKLNIEQSSSEITAGHKAQISVGKSVLDLTGGLGVDSYFFSKKTGQVIHCEIDSELSKIAAHNFNILQIKNIETIAQNGTDFLQESSRDFDWIFIDPSRRNDVKGKVFLLSDCLPNVPQHLELLFKKSNHILIKTSPLLDFSAGIKELQFVKEIHVVAVQNEVKELLWVLEKEYSNEIYIKTIDYSKSGIKTFDFLLVDEKQAVSDLAMPLTYLYEPNSAILKSGAFKTLGTRFQLQKLHEHSHLYTSDQLIDFPGRSFKIEEKIPYTKKAIQKSGLQKANITIRNFPESVATIRKKFKIKDGGDVYLFFTTNMLGDYVVLRCSKIT